jgi:hypothetical protein
MHFKTSGVQVNLLPANELDLRVPTLCEVVSSEASSASERKQKNQNQTHCLALDRSITPMELG